MAKKRKGNLAIKTIIAETNQSFETRKPLLEKIESLFGKPVVSLFTSFEYPVMLEDSDVDMLAGFLQMMDLSKGVILIISSPGGDGLAAERLINVCRKYSGTGEYEVVVPGKAKSAATVVCFGASKIWMGPTSELGPVDPQIVLHDLRRVVSAYSLVQSYKDLFDKAVKESGHIEPYIQQLEKYDSRMIKQYEMDIALSESIAIGALNSGMMKGCSNDEIRKKIKDFLTPERTLSHGRPIYKDEAASCGLNVEEIPVNSELWPYVYELYIRTERFVSRQVSKCTNNREQEFIVPPPED